MQPYGQGQLIGSSIDPRLFQQDFSGFTRAAETQAQGMSNLGNQIGQTIGQLAVDFDKRKKEQTEQEKEIKRAESIGKMISTSMPEYAEIVTPLIEQMNDKNIPLDERFALANSISDTLKIGVEFKKISMDQAEAKSVQDVRLSQLGQAKAQAETEAEAKETDKKIKSTVGPALLEQVLAMAPKSISDNVKANSGSYTDEEKYSLASSVMSLIPKSERAKVPQTMEITLPDGSKQQSQWDEISGTFVPIKTSGIGLRVPTGEFRDLPNQDVGPGLLPPNDPNDPAPPSSLPLPIGRTPPPSISPKDQQAMNLAQEKADTEKSDSMAKKVAAVGESQEMISALEKLENHPGFSALFGAYIPFTRSAGTPGASAMALFKQIEGKGFLEAIKSMKGLGALSDAEGLKASSAYLGLATEMQETEAKARIQELKTLVQNGIDRARSGKLINPDGTPLVIGAKSDATDANATTLGRQLLDLPPIK